MRPSRPQRGGCAFTALPRCGALFMTHLFKTRRQRLLTLALAAVFAAAAMIFVFSAQSGDDSERLSGGLTEWLVRLIKPSCETMSPDERLAFLEKCHHAVRKAVHFCEFALLAFTLSVYFHIKRGSWNMRDALAALALSVVYACTDEVHQMFVSARGPSVKDVLTDSLGALFAVSAFALVSRLKHKLAGKAKQSFKMGQTQLSTN